MRNESSNIVAHIAVVIPFLEDRVLLMRYTQPESRPQIWRFPSVKLLGNSTKEAACRAMKRQAGLKIDPRRLRTLTTIEKGDKRYTIFSLGLSKEEATRAPRKSPFRKKSCRVCMFSRDKLEHWQKFKRGQRALIEMMGSSLKAA